MSEKNRGKTFLPPKLAAVRTREEKKEKAKEIAESNKKAKDTKKTGDKKENGNKKSEEIGKRKEGASFKATS